uniref:Putative secreted protein n=1 Tax=Ixodes ricinus TaxID=34613 RepID=A0A6B0UHJ4_IXORI
MLSRLTLGLITSIEGAVAYSTPSCNRRLLVVPLATARKTTNIMKTLCRVCVWLYSSLQRREPQQAAAARRRQESSCLCIVAYRHFISQFTDNPFSTLCNMCD